MVGTPDFILDEVAQLIEADLEADLDDEDDD